MQKFKKVTNTEFYALVLKLERVQNLYYVLQKHADIV